MFASASHGIGRALLIVATLVGGLLVLALARAWFGADASDDSDARGMFIGSALFVLFVVVLPTFAVAATVSAFASRALAGQPDTPRSRRMRRMVAGGFLGAAGGALFGAYLTPTLGVPLAVGTLAGALLAASLPVPDNGSPEPASGRDA